MSSFELSPISSRSPIASDSGHSRPAAARCAVFDLSTRAKGCQCQHHTAAGIDTFEGSDTSMGAEKHQCAVRILARSPLQLACTMMHLPTSLPHLRSNRLARNPGSQSIPSVSTPSLSLAKTKEKYAFVRRSSWRPTLWGGGPAVTPARVGLLLPGAYERKSEHSRLDPG